MQATGLILSPCPQPMPCVSLQCNRRALLHLLLDPGPGLEPRWDDACYLIAELGGCWA